MGRFALSPVGQSGNAKFGWMFLWVGCFCQLLWLCAFLGLKQYSQADFAPLFVYSALVVSGIVLTPSEAESDRAAVLLRLAASSFPPAVTRLSSSEHVRIMVIGPDALIQTVLAPHLGSSALIVESVETAGAALQKLRFRPQPDLPQVLIMPWVLPVIRSADFIRALKVEESFRSMKIIVWGPGIPAWLIQSLYQAGANCVIPDRFDQTMGKALAEFCIGLADQPAVQTPSSTSSVPISQVQPKAECSTKRLLKARYKVASDTHVEASESLRGKTESVMFREAYERVSRARDALENAKAELKSHYQEHGCGKLDE